MLEEIREAVAAQFNCPASQIELETSFKDDLGADSLDLYELILALEERFDLELPTEELTEVGLETIEDVVEYLKSKGVEV